MQILTVHEHHRNFKFADVMRFIAKSIKIWSSIFYEQISLPWNCVWTNTNLVPESIGIGFYKNWQIDYTFRKLTNILYTWIRLSTLCIRHSGAIRPNLLSKFCKDVLNMKSASLKPMKPSATFEGELSIYSRLELSMNSNTRP